MEKISKILSFLRKRRIETEEEEELEIPPTKKIDSTKR